jgi:membrane associated rhomboid family serine protease
MSSWRRTAVGEFVLGIPLMIRLIMAACVALWLAELVTFRAMSAAWLELGLSLQGLLAGRVWTLLTYQFLHDPLGIAHLAFNMLALWMFGRELESRWGSWHFLTFYLTCGVGGGLLFAALSLLTGGGVAMGASAGVLGVTMAYALIWPHRKLLLFFVLPMEARHAVIVIALLELVLAWSGTSGVANFAHLGGMATAWLYLRYLSGLGRLPEALARKVSDLRWKWRRRKMRTVERDWERMLSEDDDGRRH